MAKKKSAEKTPKKMGRPKIDIDMDQLAAFCRVKPTLDDCAAFFKCTPQTIKNKIKEHSGLTFLQFREQYLVECRHDLIRSAIKQAQDGNATLMIFALKNLAGWKDKHDVEVTTIKPSIIERSNGDQIILDVTPIKEIGDGKDDPSNS